MFIGQLRQVIPLDEIRSAGYAEMSAEGLQVIQTYCALTMAGLVGKRMSAGSLTAEMADSITEAVMSGDPEYAGKSMIESAADVPHVLRSVRGEVVTALREVAAQFRSEKQSDARLDS